MPGVARRQKTLAKHNLILVIMPCAFGSSRQFEFVTAIVVAALATQRVSA